MMKIGKSFGAEHLIEPAVRNTVKPGLETPKVDGAKIGHSSADNYGDDEPRTKAGRWFHSNRTPEVAAVTDKKDGTKVGQKKTLVIGLDAVRLDLMLKLLGEGKLPNLEKLIDSGTFIRGQNEQPTVSATNWISIVSSVTAKSHKADTRNNEESFSRAKRNGTFPPLFYDQLIRKRPELQSAVFSAWTAYFDHCVE